MTHTDVVLCHPRRTAVGRFGGTLKSVPATQLGATVVRAVLEQSELENDQVDGVVMGHVITAGQTLKHQHRTHPTPTSTK